ncbi:MAG: tetratricopeptide repeat protein [Candidatus Eisenbacteria bacterium]|uniref:Tetratricopeptide repeat protein n=1 Tax=Eiseniibacteriota bacterium TaxID=2212470 RepID=A0A933SGH6_UNCEI|nr:tetratricopeptide repeat protein [Candidatus Eisenbacteria bacterium]
MHTFRSLCLPAALAAAATFALSLALAPAPAHAESPTFFVPARPDSSVDISSPAAPLLLPGRSQPEEAPAKSRQQAALEKFQLALSLEAQRAPAAAIAAYRSAVKLDSTIAQAHYRMGMLYAGVGQHRAAATEFAAEIVHHPGDRSAARMLGLALAQDGDTLHALQQLRRLVQLEPKDAEAWRALGFALSVAERPADGERAFRRSLALRPEDGPTWRDLGALLAATRRDEEARKAYRKAAAYDPRDAASLVNLGNLERRAKRPEAALAAYREAEQRDSTQTLAYRAQVQVLIELKRELEAGAVFRRWLAVYPDETATRVEAIQLYQGLGRQDIALELARDGIRRAPDSGEARLAYGMALHSSGQERDALEELRRAESWLKKPEQRLRVGALIRSLRADAPDSLRAVFEADSAKYERAPRGDGR